MGRILPTSRNSQIKVGVVWILFGLLITGCQTVAKPTPDNSPLPSVTTPPTVFPSATPSLILTPAPLPTGTPLALSSACSPLKGIALDELYAITSNPFSFTSSYSDTGHPAIDLAFFTFKDFTTFMGHPVQALLPGKVSLVVNNRFPYGNMVLIETPLDRVSPDLLNSLSLPTPIPEENISLFSSCDAQMPPLVWDGQNKSLYTLYAHLENDPSVQVGDQVSCGGVIGAVGLSGNTVAEHLHLEVRVGPADAQFNSIATYHDDATPQERYNYCIWSISGIFQAIDPSLFWRSTP